MARAPHLALALLCAAGAGIAKAQEAPAPPVLDLPAVPAEEEGPAQVPPPPVAAAPRPAPVPAPPAHRPPAPAEGAERASPRSEFGESGSPPPLAATGTGFDFGSYGRISLGSDLRGHSGYGVNVVSFGSRLEKPAYLELNFYYGGTMGDGGDGPQRRWRVVVVPAFAGDLFHYTGDFQQHFALRNAYAETENLGARGLRLWAGSRMYRGDDVYLFDFWPLDNLNTVGGGAGYRFDRERTDLALHAGMNRLDDLYQFQQLQLPSRGLPKDAAPLSPQTATTDVTTLDRPRLVMSFKATRFLRVPSALPNGKLSLYGEFHYLPSGERRYPGQQQGPLALKEDYGWVVGLQAGGWLRPFVFANLFVRGAGGLGAFGDLGLPYGFNSALQVTGARELTVALSTNWEGHRLGLMGGAYFRVFRDANAADNSGFDEGAAALRPVVYLARYFHAAVELSYQVRQPVQVDPDTGNRLLPQVFRFSVLPIVAPLGCGTYSRPMLFAVYTVSALNNDAVATLFDPQDVRAGQSTVHYLGLGAEWWFNSSYR